MQKIVEKTTTVPGRKALVIRRPRFDPETLISKPKEAQKSRWLRHLSVEEIVDLGTRLQQDAIEVTKKEKLERKHYKNIPVEIKGRVLGTLGVDRAQDSQEGN